MHDNPARNVADYIGYFAFWTLLVSAGLLFFLPDADRRAWAIAPGMGLVSALTAIKRDGAYRQVPADVATGPRKFAKQAERALDASAAHIQETQQTAATLQQTAAQLQVAVEQMRQATAPGFDPHSGVTLGRGFD